MQEYYGFLPLTAYLAVNYMDRFLSLHRLPVSSLAPPSLFPYMNYFNICIQTYQQNMSTMCDEWLIVLVFPLHIILSYKSMVVAIEEVYMVSLHTVCVCVVAVSGEVHSQSAVVLMLVWKKKGFGRACPRGLIK